MGDEAPHQDPLSAIQLDTLDCDDAAASGGGVIDSATWEDWWWFQGNDISGCEPDSVHVQVTSGSPMPVCMYVQFGCTPVCIIGDDDGSGFGCCGTDDVELSVTCMAMTDSTGVYLRFGDGSEQCQAITFDYEF
jgi:hypothetical protein